jgi:UDP-glucose 4-epimerase
MTEAIDKTVLITGAAGFIGSAVAVRLAAMGYRVAGCDNFNDYYDPALKHHRVEALLGPAGVACEQVELSDVAQVTALFERVQPALVVHLAAQAGVRYSLKNPAVYVQANMSPSATCWKPAASTRSSTCCTPAAAASTVRMPRRRSARAMRPMNRYRCTPRPRRPMN